MLGISLHRAVITVVIAPAVIGLALSTPKAAGRQPGDIGRIEGGTRVPVRTTENIEEHSLDERIFAGEVADDVTDTSGRVAIPRGSPVELAVRDAGNGDLVLDLESIVVNGQRFAVRTGTERVDAAPRPEDNHRTATYVGGGALLGTIIGAVAGGGKGAVIGAAAGAAAGAGAGILTRGREIRVPRDSLVTFRLERPLDVGVPDGGYDRDQHHYHPRSY
jgi:hypothetical protein